MDLPTLYKTIADAWAAGVVATMNVHVKDEAEARVHMRACRDAGMRIEHRVATHDTCETVTARGPGFVSHVAVMWPRPERVAVRRVFELEEVAECQ